MHHPAAAISPGGVVHLVGSSDWSDMSTTKSDAFHFTWDVEGGETKWVERARYLGAAGGFACEFLGELMYCCRGGRRLQERTGKLVRVYKPGDDSWSDAAPLPEPADHIALIAYEGELWAVGGASTFDPRYGSPNPRFAHDHYRHSVTQLAVYNPGANQWSVRQPLPNPRAAPIVTVIQRPGKRPSMLVGGGEVYLGSNGMAMTSLSEYDFKEDVWFCHVDPFPFPVFGAGSALWNDKWYILGGGESYNLAATNNRVMIVDVANMPTPEPCAAQQGSQARGWWKSKAASWQQNFPYPKQFLEKRK